MKTRHQLYWQNAQKMNVIDDESIALVVTSPPYPMIQMWDDLFCELDPDISELLKQNGTGAFEKMHQQLDLVWKEVFRVLLPGGFACINIGDAVRTLNQNFSLYPNHVRILQYCQSIGFNVLPVILWRKPTNAPNKFMGSGMLPAGAYVTLEHEYILVLRKGGKREFSSPELKKLRNESAYFWEERNQWFSDVWLGIIGANQKMVDASIRKRSGAFPFEIPYRLINMYSVKGDSVLDPFCGIGTTLMAAMVAGRNSIGIDLNKDFETMIQSQFLNLVPFAAQQVNDRLKRHYEFLTTRKDNPVKNKNEQYGFPVVTRQESRLLLNELLEVKKVSNNCYEGIYAEEAQLVFTMRE